MRPLLFYCGLNERNWNRQPVAPGPLACVAPVYGSKESTRRVNSVSVPVGTQVIQDSGAFSDGPGSRLSFQAALDRQRRHADKYQYADKITHRASYDLLIDEKWENGSRSKQRWAEADAWSAVSETVRAAEFLTQHRDGMGLILSAQGVTPFQYLTCAMQIAPMLQRGDIFGLGGWCITGKLPKVMMPTYCETMNLVIPYLASKKVRRAHVWGVLHAPALAHLLRLCDLSGIVLSTDSAGPSRRPAFGQWGYAEWTDKTYKRPPVETRGLERARHVQAVRDWLARFRETPHYQSLMPTNERVA